MARGADIVVDDRVTIPAYEYHEEFLVAGGPGGQHVNKTATAVQLRFFAEKSGVLPPPVKRRLLRLAGSRATKDGEIILDASRHRSQERNRAEARERLAELVRKALEPPPPPRKKTRPTRGSIERRLQAKKARGALKSARGDVDL